MVPQANLADLAIATCRCFLYALRKTRETDMYIGIGVALGAAIGAATHNVAIGASIGLVIGVVLTAAKKRSDNPEA